MIKQRFESGADVDALCEKLRSMRLPSMAAELKRLYSDPNFDLRSAPDLIAGLVNAEWDARRAKKTNKFFKRAGLRYPDADFDDMLYDPSRLLDVETILSLADCGWVAEGRNILITGLTGTGKTHMGCALCACALRRFMSAKYVKASDLIYSFEQSDERRDTSKMLEEYASYDVLVIDDFGLMPLNPNRCRYLFQIIDSREGRKSTMVISQLPLGAWYDLFEDKTYADAVLDRLAYKAYRINMNGKNVRNPELQKRADEKKAG